MSPSEKSLSEMVGKQIEGGSSDKIYDMALRAIRKHISAHSVVADVGGGAGSFSKLIRGEVERVMILDHDPPHDLEKIESKECDLNGSWPVHDLSFDMVIALEVIEHVENPRAFLRKVKRMLKNGGACFISTPNNESFFSRLNFLLNGQHRYFQDSNYPAHITPLLSKDFKRMSGEMGLEIKKFYFTGREVIPKVGLQLQGGGKLFSGNFGVLMKK